MSKHDHPPTQLASYVNALNGFRTDLANLASTPDANGDEQHHNAINEHDLIITDHNPVLQDYIDAVAAQPTSQDLEGFRRKLLTWQNELQTRERKLEENEASREGYNRAQREMLPDGFQSTVTKVKREEGEIERLEDEIRRLDTALQERDRKLSELHHVNGKNEELEQQMQTMRLTNQQPFEELKQHLDKQFNTLRGTENPLQQANEKTITELRSAQTRLQTKVTECEQEHTQPQAEIVKLGGKVEVLQNQLQQYQQNRESSVSDSAGLRIEIRLLKERIETLENDKRVQEKEIIRLKVDNELLKAQRGESLPTRPQRAASNVDQNEEDLPDERQLNPRPQLQLGQPRSDAPTPPLTSSYNRNNPSSDQNSDSPQSNVRPAKRQRTIVPNPQPNNQNPQNQPIDQQHERETVEPPARTSTPHLQNNGKDPNERPPVFKEHKGPLEHTEQELFTAFDIFSDTHGRLPATQLDDELKAELFRDGPELEKYLSEKGWTHLTTGIRKNTPKCAAWRYFGCVKTSIKVGDAKENHACRYCRKHGLLCIVKSSNDEKPLLMPLPAAERTNVSPDQAAYWRRSEAWNATKALVPS